MNKKSNFDEKNSRQGQSEFDKIISEIIHESVVLIGHGFCELFRLLRQSPIFTLSALAALYYACSRIIFNNMHLVAIHNLAPEFLTMPRLGKWFGNISPQTLELSLFGIALTPILMALGFNFRLMREKHQRLFTAIGLKNGEGHTPVLVYKRKIDAFKEEYVFDSKYIGKSEFESKKERLEGAFEKPLGSIEYGKTQKFIKLIFNSDKLPTRVTLSELFLIKDLGEGEFIVGKSSAGIVTETISDLPHMLVAGATGGGKSVFFKQTLACLLKTTPMLQLYIIDLKRGLEAVDFKAAPSVVIVKNLQDAAALLSKLVKKMEGRFDYLEKSGKKEINPTKDKMERIVVAIDECSVLLAKRDRSDPEIDSAVQARFYVESIAKLGRAAAINLILATQKIEKDTIPTAVQENINGRMVFKANTQHGSLAPLGSTDALHLPDIPGRGIWKSGNMQETIQAPLISEKEVREIAADVAAQFKNGTRAFHEQMINPEKVFGSKTEKSIGKVLESME